jgi:hypothetical protein
MRLELARAYASVATILPYGEKTFAIVNCASNFASEVGDVLGKDHAFAVMFVVSPKDKIVIASMRSNAQTGVDVSVIVKQFGGGGHVNAAGFSFNYETEPNMLIELLNGELFKEHAIGFNTPIDKPLTLYRISRFYQEWFSANACKDVGEHVIEGDELKMLENAREFMIKEFGKTYSIIQCQTVLLVNEKLNEQFD